MSYSDIFSQIVANLEPCVTQNPATFRILAYLKPNIYSELCQGIFWHTQNIV